MFCLSAVIQAGCGTSQDDLDWILSHSQLCSDGSLFSGVSEQQSTVMPVRNNKASILLDEARLCSAFQALAVLSWLSYPQCHALLLDDIWRSFHHVLLQGKLPERGEIFREISMMGLWNIEHGSIHMV